ncbi:MAG: hypothetical protein ACTSRS_15575 [Candidatus Helarchaeota archaeon]
MPGVKNFILLLETGEVLLQHTFFMPELKEKDPELLSGFLVAIQRLIADFGEKGEGVIEMQRSKIVFLKDRETNLIFVLNCEEWVNTKKVSKLLFKIYKKFNQLFKDHLGKFTAQQLRGYITNLFVFELEKMVS